MNKAIAAIPIVKDRKRCADALRELAEHVEKGHASCFVVAAIKHPNKEKTELSYDAITTRNVEFGVLTLAARRYVRDLEAWETQDWL